MPGKIRCVDSLEALKGQPAGKGSDKDNSARGAAKGAARGQRARGAQQAAAAGPCSPPPQQQQQQRVNAACGGSGLRACAEEWAAPPPPAAGAFAPTDGDYHGWAPILDPREAADMHRQLVLYHHRTLSYHFELMWYHQVMLSQSIAAGTGAEAPEIVPPPVPPLPPPVSCRYRQLQRGVPRGPLALQRPPTAERPPKPIPDERASLGGDSTHSRTADSGASGADQGLTESSQHGGSDCKEEESKDGEAH
eukprot:TRINITY_DN4378_c11_g1_i1.p2 TRINITY_DN4378_c11_g1~~TRINITY_DN4378_c11_g1_i1.p2  ORF type:complete len:250 (+),score=83.51 TRINITY_DN4378_c11_g1_i1:118-867(+)